MSNAGVKAVLVARAEAAEARAAMAVKALQWIATDAVYKAPEEHNWLSQRYAAHASAALGRCADLNSTQVVVGSPEKLRDHNLVARLRAKGCGSIHFDAADALSELGLRHTIAAKQREALQELLAAAEARAEKLERLAASAVSYLEPHNSLRDELARLQNPDTVVPPCDCGAELGHGYNCSYSKWLDARSANRTS